MLYTMWIVMLIAGFALLVLSIVLTFVFHVPDILDELSGRKAKRQIKKLKELNLGTGALEDSGIKTDDIYQAISSGSLLSEEISIADSESHSFLQKSINEAENDVVSKGNEVVTADLTNNIEGGKTEYIEPEDTPTSYIGETDVTNMLSDIEAYNSQKRIIEIIEEQSSI